MGIIESNMKQEYKHYYNHLYDNSVFAGYPEYFPLQDNNENKVYFNKTFNNIFPNKSEYFINESKSILYIAQLIEFDNFSQDILDYIKFKEYDNLIFFYKEYFETNGSIEIIKKWKLIFIKLLFEEYSSTYRCSLIKTIIKFNPIFQILFGIKAQLIDKLLIIIEWEWNCEW